MKDEHPDIPPIFVIHVKGETRRRQIIDAELQAKNLQAEFILYGNKEDITDEIRAKYFSGKMLDYPGNMSCAWKHLMVYEKMRAENIPLALVLEDDIALYKNFMEVLLQSIREIQQRKLQRILVSYEESLLVYVKGSERKKGTLLYPADRGRLTGAYLADREAALAMLEYIRQKPTDQPIDWFHNECADHKIIDIYWCQPPIACQRSLMGTVESLIDRKKTGPVRQWSFYIQRWYKRLLYRLR